MAYNKRQKLQDNIEAIKVAFAAERGVELSGFKCKDGKPFKARLRRDDKGGVSFVFSQKK